MKIQFFLRKKNFSYENPKFKKLKNPKIVISRGLVLSHCKFNLAKNLHRARSLLDLPPYNFLAQLVIKQPSLSPREIVFFGFKGPYLLSSKSTLFFEKIVIFLKGKVYDQKNHIFKSLKKCLKKGNRGNFVAGTRFSTL